MSSVQELTAYLESRLKSTATGLEERASTLQAAESRLARREAQVGDLPATPCMLSGMPCATISKTLTFFRLLLLLCSWPCALIPSSDFLGKMFEMQLNTP